MAEAEGCTPECRQALLNIVDCSLHLWNGEECLDYNQLVAAIGAADPYVPPVNLCRIATGTYTGDGTLGQAIVGVGFAPKYVAIWRHKTGEGLTEDYKFEKLDKGWGDYAYAHVNTAVGQVFHYTFDNRVNSLDADGFTVDDDGADSVPNSLQVVYDYLALG